MECELLVRTIIVKSPIKDTPKEDKPPNKGQAESTLVYTITSERVQPLCKGQEQLAPKVSLLRGSTVFSCPTVVAVLVVYFC